MNDPIDRARRVVAETATTILLMVPLLPRNFPDMTASFASYTPSPSRKGDGPKALDVLK